MASLLELADFYLTDKGSIADMGSGPHNYCEFYEKHLTPIRYNPIKLLEIGVWKGASLNMWRDWMPNATIVGLDHSHINVPGCITVKGDQSDAFDLHRVATLGPFDVIIDDGSHAFMDQLTSFFFLFPFHMIMGGMYFIEDLAEAHNNGRTREFFGLHTPRFAAEVEFGCKNQVVMIRGRKDKPDPGRP